MLSFIIASFEQTRTNSLVKFVYQCLSLYTTDSPVEDCYNYLIKLCASLQKAHIFNLPDGMAFEGFVIEGWRGDEVSVLSYFDFISKDSMILLML